MKNLNQQKENERTGTETRVRDVERRTYWTKRQERFMKIASQAEAQSDYFTAGRAFVLTLFCEGRLKDDVVHPWAYVLHAMPVY